jgi:hypothetical protein
MDTDIGLVMDRDRRLTGFLRGQTDNPIAPAGFELNNPWRVRYAIGGQLVNLLTCVHSSRSESYRIEMVFTTVHMVGEGMQLSETSPIMPSYDGITGTRYVLNNHAACPLLVRLGLKLQEY